MPGYDILVTVTFRVDKSLDRICVSTFTQHLHSTLTVYEQNTHLHSLPDTLIAARLDVVHACSVLPIHLFYLLLAEP